MWEISPQVNSPKNDDVNTGSDRDDGKRLTRFDVAIAISDSLEVTMSLPGGKAVAEIRLDDFS
jgi:hypothetical protein